MKIPFDRLYKTVIGIVKDYHFTSAKKIEPLIIGCSHSGGNVLIQLGGNDLQQSIASIAEVWNMTRHGFPWFFLMTPSPGCNTAESIQSKMFTLFFIYLIAIALDYLGHRKVVRRFHLEGDSDSGDLPRGPANVIVISLRLSE